MGKNKNAEIKKYRIYTTLNTLEKAYDIFEDIGCLSQEEAAKPNVLKLTQSLFVKGQLRELLNVITGGELGQDDISGKQATDILSDFFLELTENWNMQVLFQPTEENIA